MIVKRRHAAVITFAINPKKVLNADLHPGDILTLNQKLAELEVLGVNTAVIIDFSDEFSRLSTRDFFDQIESFMEVELLAVGSNFRCGKGGETGVSELRNILPETQVIALDPLTYQGYEISSSRIRSAIRRGEIPHVNGMLGRPHSVLLPIDTRRAQADLFTGAFTGDTSKLRQGIRKSLVSQVIPDYGRYRGSVGIDGQFVATRQIQISKEMISWTLDNPGVYDTLRFEGVIEDYNP